MLGGLGCGRETVTSALVIGQPYSMAPGYLLVRGNYLLMGSLLHWGVLGHQAAPRWGEGCDILPDWRGQGRVDLGW